MNSPQVQQLRTLIASTTKRFSGIYLLARTSPARTATNEREGTLQRQLHFLSLFAPDSARHLAFPEVSAFNHSSYSVFLPHRLNDQLVTSPGDNLVILVCCIDRLFRSPDTLHQIAAICETRRITISVMAFFDWTTLSENVSEALLLDDADSFDLWRNTVPVQACFPNSQRPVVQPHFVLDIDTSGAITFNPYRSREIETNFVSSRVHCAQTDTMRTQTRLQRTIAVPKRNAPITRTLARDILAVDLSIITYRYRAAVLCPCLTRPHDNACVCGCPWCRQQPRCQIPGHTVALLDGLVTNAYHGRVCRDCGQPHTRATILCDRCHKKSRTTKTCGDCGKTYMGSTLLCRRCYYKSRPPKTCGDCGKTYKGENLLCNTCFRKSRAPKTCPDCGKTHQEGTLLCQRCYKKSRKKT